MTVETGSPTGGSVPARHEPGSAIAPSAVVPDTCTVWDLVQIREDAVIGDECIIGRGAYVGRGVRIGRRSKVQNFAQVGVSDLNRRCTGTTPGAGKASAHWKGKAVDFYAKHKKINRSSAAHKQLMRARPSNADLQKLMKSRPRRGG